MDTTMNQNGNHHGNYTQPKDFLVTGLDQIEPAYAQFEGHMYAGMLPSDNGNRTGMTQFWMFQPTTQEIPNTIVVRILDDCNSLTLIWVYKIMYPPSLSSWSSFSHNSLCFRFLSLSLSLYSFG
jgi:hypothetical protein